MSVPLTTELTCPISGHSTFLIEAIDQRERELRNIDERLNAWGPGLQQVQPSDVTDFVKDRLAKLCDLLTRESRKLHEDSETRGNVHKPVQRPGAVAHEHRRVHRGVLQSAATALGLWLPISRGIRATK